MAVLKIGGAGNSYEDRAPLAHATRAQLVVEYEDVTQNAFVRDHRSRDKLRAYVRATRNLGDAWDGFDRLQGEPTNSLTMVARLNTFVGQVRGDIYPTDQNLAAIEAKLREGEHNLPPVPTYVP